MKKALFIPSWETINKKHKYQFDFFKKYFDHLYLITTSKFTNINEISRNKKIEIYLNNNFFFRFIKYFYFLKKNKYTLNYAILSPYGLSSILFFLLSKYFKLKIVSIEWGVIDVYNKKSFLEKLFIKFIFKRSDAIWFKEPYMKKKLKIFKNDKLFFINNSISPLNLNNKYINNQKKSIDFLWVNRFADNRTPEIPINALLELKKKYNFKAVFLGDIFGKYAHLNKYDEFQFFNFSNPESFYKKSRFFIGSGPRYFGNNSLIEAMNYGVIPIINESDDIDRIVENNINGFICKNDSNSFLLQFIYCLKLDEINKRKISVQANKKINEKFSNNLWEEKMNNLLESIKN